MAESEEPIRLAIVDDHRMLLGALSEWIRGAASDIELVAAVPSWSELLAHPEFPVDVVLLDLDLRDNIPISLKLSMLKSAGVQTMLMSTYSEPAVVREALGAGALGYLVKSEPVENIIEAIRAARVGDSYLTPELELALADDGAVPKLSRAGASRHGALRRRPAGEGGGLPARHLRGDREELPQAHPREVPRRRLRRRHQGRAAQARDPRRHPAAVRLSGCRGRRAGPDDRDDALDPTRRCSTTSTAPVAYGTTTPRRPRDAVERERGERRASTPAIVSTRPIQIGAT